MLARVPGFKPRRVDAPVSLVDVLPTVLDLLGLAAPANLDGVSLAGAMRGEASAIPRTLYAMEHSYLWQDGEREYLPRADPIRIAALPGDRWYIGGEGEEELYAASSDPGQTRNLAGSDPATSELRRSARAAGVWSAPDSAPVLVGEELERHLRAMGYLE